MKNLTLDELIDMEVTQEVIDEASKRVWEAQMREQGVLNVDEGTWDTLPSQVKRALDVTKPENFWPLAEKNDISIIRTSDQNGIKFFIAVYRWQVWDNERRDIWNTETTFDVRHVAPGLAVAFAFLKIKEGEK